MSPSPAGKARRRRTAAAVLLLGGLTAAGLAALGRLPLEVLPSPTSAALHVALSAPGLSAPEVEAALVRPLEQTLLPLAGVTRMESASTPGAAYLVLPLADERDAVAARQALEARLHAARNRLPALFEAHVTLEHEPRNPASEYALVFRCAEPGARLAWLYDTLLPSLAELPELARVRIEGAPEPELHVLVDARRLTALGLSLDDLLAVLRGHRLPPAAAPAAAAEALAAVPVTLPSGERVALSEIARVSPAQAPQTASVREDGAAAVRLTFVPRSPEGAYPTAEAVAARIAWLEANRLIPEEVEVRALRDQAAETRRALRPVAWALLGTALVVLVLVQGLAGDRRVTLTVAAAMLAALAAALVAQALSGGSLNALMLGAVAAGVGLFAIPAWLPVGEALAARRSRLLLAVSPSVMVLIATWRLDGAASFYLHGLLVPVLAGWLAAVLAQPLAPSAAASLAWAGRLPRLAERWRHRRRAVRAVSAAAGGIAVLAAAVVLLVGPGMVSFSLPPLDDGRLHVRFEADTPQAVHELERRVRALPGVQWVSLRMGQEPFSPAPWAGGLRADADGQDMRSLMRTLEDSLDNDPIPGLRAEVGSGSADPYPPPSLRLRLYGPDLATLATLADELVHRLESVPGLRAVRHDLRQREQTALHLDRDRAALLGLDPARVARAAAAAENGIVLRGAEEESGAHRIALRLLLPGEAQRVPVLGETRERPAVYLHEVAQTQRALMPAFIRHANRERVVEITADFRTGYSPARVVAQAQAELRAQTLPSGYRLERDDNGAPSVPTALSALGLVLVLSAMAAGFCLRAWRAAALAVLVTTVALLLAAAAWTLFAEPLSLPVWAGGLLAASLGTLAATAVLAYPDRGRAIGLLLPPLAGAAAFLAFGAGPAWPLLQPFALILLVVFASVAACLALVPPRVTAAWNKP